MLELMYLVAMGWWLIWGFQSLQDWWVTRRASRYESERQYWEALISELPYSDRKWIRQQMELAEVKYD